MYGTRPSCLTSKCQRQPRSPCIAVTSVASYTFSCLRAPWSSKQTLTLQLFNEYVSMPQLDFPPPYQLPALPQHLAVLDAAAWPSQHSWSCRCEVMAGSTRLATYVPRAQK